MPSAYQGGGVTVHLFVSFVAAVAGNSYWQVAFEKMEAGGIDIDGDSFEPFRGAAGTPAATSGYFIDVSIAFTNGSQMDSIVAGDMFRLKVRRDADGSAGTDDITTQAELIGVYVEET